MAHVQRRCASVTESVRPTCRAGCAGSTSRGRQVAAARRCCARGARRRAQHGPRGRQARVPARGLEQRVVVAVARLHQLVDEQRAARHAARGERLGGLAHRVAHAADLHPPALGREGEEPRRRGADRRRAECPPRPRRRSASGPRGGGRGSAGARRRTPPRRGAAKKRAHARSRRASGRATPRGSSGWRGRRRGPAPCAACSAREKGRAPSFFTQLAARAGRASSRSSSRLPVLALAVGAAEVVAGDVAVGVAHQQRVALVEEQLDRLARVGAAQRQVSGRDDVVGRRRARCPRARPRRRAGSRGCRRGWRPAWLPSLSVPGCGVSRSSLLARQERR